MFSFFKKPAKPLEPKEVNVPRGFTRTDDFPPITGDAIGYAYEDEGTFATLVIGTIQPDESLFVVPDVVEGMRSCLEENQGLITVGDGKTLSGRDSRWTIIKTHLHEHVVQYCLTLQILDGQQVLLINMFTEENGPTGVRDSMVYAALSSQGDVGPDMRGWRCDPFEDRLIDGFPMNLSELEELDARFPTHPLSEARAALRFMNENN